MLSPKRLALLTLLLGVSTAYAAPSLSQADRSSGSRVEAQSHRDTQRVEICQKRESAIQRRSDHMNRSLDKHLAKLSKLQARVESRYVKVTARGVSVPEYPNLLAAANAAKGSAATAIATVKTQSSFSCTPDDPKGQISSFRAGMQAAKQALHAYLRAIRDLNVAISRAAGVEKRSAGEAK